MKHLLLASLITLLTIGTACGQAAEPEPEPVASDGIQVHGNWTVTVTNPDGTVDAVHEFENDLSNHGPVVLTLLLTGKARILRESESSRWQIDLRPTSSESKLFCEEGSTSQVAGDSFAGVAQANQLPALEGYLKNGTDLFTTYGFRLDALCTVTGIESETGTHSINMVDTIAVWRTIDSDGQDTAIQDYDSTFTRHYLDEDIIVKDQQLLLFSVEITF